MKKKLAFILALVFVLALFAGCGGKNTGNTGNNAAKPTASGNDTAKPTDQPDTPTEEPSPYNFAIGKYEVNEAGFPTEKYVYELPLSTTGESFTKWTTCYTPQFIPEGGARSRYGSCCPSGLAGYTGLRQGYRHHNL